VRPSRVNTWGDKGLRKYSLLHKSTSTTTIKRC
jgi:hypothetical protein